MEPSQPLRPMSSRDQRVSLTDSDKQALAGRVRELLTREASTQGRRRLVDAREAARRLGVEHQWVVDHARDLGGVRLGGTGGRLRFDLAVLKRHLACPDARKRGGTSAE